MTYIEKAQLAFEFSTEHKGTFNDIFDQLSWYWLFRAAARSTKCLL